MTKNPYVDFDACDHALQTGPEDGFKHHRCLYCGGKRELGSKVWKKDLDLNEEFRNRRVTLEFPLPEKGDRVFMVRVKDSGEQWCLYADVSQDTFKESLVRLSRSMEATFKP